MKLSFHLLGVLGLALPTQAELVSVTVTGAVDQNQIASGELGTVSPGDPVTMTFVVDSAVFTDSASVSTRGYDIDPASFSMTLGPATIELQDPFPPGQTPFFVIRDDDPAVDGFFVATSVDFPIGIPTDENGVFGAFVDNYSVTYGGAALSSLDILGALGSYDFTGLTVFNWTIDDGPFNPLLINFQGMTLQQVGQPVPTLPGWGLLALSVALIAAAIPARRRASSPA